ncbi:MAG: hypothetical protein RL737_229 [Bacteroidota bacterium]
MPKPKFRISQAVLNALKMKLEDALSYRIKTKLDCKHVSQVITEKTGKKISESTIYRLFLWENNINSPYLHTLEIIADFIGYPSWLELEGHLHELCKFRVTSGVFADSFDSEPYSILYHCIQIKSFDALRSFFNQFPSDVSFEKKLILGEEIYAALYRNPESTTEFYEEFHAVPIVRESFFEYFADPQFKLEHYEEGLNLYLQNIHPDESLHCLQDYIFANCLLLRHYFFSKKFSSLDKIGERLYVQLSVNQDLLNQIHVYPHIRYRSYYLFYRYFHVGFDQNYWQWLVQYAIQLAHKQVGWERKIIIHTVLDALLFDEEHLNLTYEQFSNEFTELFSSIPPHLNQRPVQQRIRFFDTNAAQLFD